MIGHNAQYHSRASSGEHHDGRAQHVQHGEIVSFRKDRFKKSHGGTIRGTDSRVTMPPLLVTGRLENAMTDQEAQRNVPPYAPWRTFETYLDGLKSFGSHGPNVIDRDTMRTFSGAMQSALMSALRSLRLMDDKGVPKARLKAIVHASPEERKALYKDIIATEYPFLSDINLMGATPRQLEAAFETTGASGDTVRKAMAFFVNLAKAGDVTMSPVLEKVRRRQRASNGARTRKPLRAVSMNPADFVDDDDEASDDPGSGTSSTAMKTIALPKAAGSITLSGDINIFNLVGEERALVFALIDKMNEFEAKAGGGDA
jgi:hypothetical protein